MSTPSSPPFPVVLAGPSGTGKTTLARRLVEKTPGFCFSVSATTRPPRPGEHDGRDYHFVDRAEFKALVAGGRLTEWAEVHGHLYGTPRSELEAGARKGCHVVLDIDVQGARKVRATVPEALLVFVLPPSVGALVGRLTARGTEPEEEVARRLRTAMDELEAVAEFDHAVVNADLGVCVEEIRGIVRAETHRTARARALVNDVEQMRVEIASLLQNRYANPKR